MGKADREEPVPAGRRAGGRGGRPGSPDYPLPLGASPAAAGAHGAETWRLDGERVVSISDSVGFVSNHAILPPPIFSLINKRQKPKRTLVSRTFLGGKG